MKTEVLFGSKTDQYETPQDLFDVLCAEFGFTLDPCADEYNHKCKKYFTKEQNGLLQDWGGEIVFCNPPYGKEIGTWVEKCYTEVHTGSCKLVVMLIPSRTDTKWFHKYIYRKAYEIRFVNKRLKFGDSKNPAPFPSMVVVFQKKRKTEELFDEIRERLEGLKEVYDTMALDEALLTIDDIEEEYNNGKHRETSELY